MPTLTVALDDGDRRFPFVPGPSLRDLLDEVGVPVRSGCRGTGACGLCLVRIEAGAIGDPTFTERFHLDDAHLTQNARLACQVRPEHDLRVTILAPAPRSVWRRLNAREQRRVRYVGPPLDPSSPVAKPYGVAVDLGTTHIRLSLHDLASGRWLAGRQGLNPQMSVGSDVIARLVAAAESSEQARAASQQVVAAIGDALWDIAVREGINLQQVARLTLVGNTAMLALLAGRNANLLLQPSHWTRAIDCRPDGTAAWAVAWGIHPAATIEVIAPLAGFVGSDLLAGVVATRLMENGVGALLIDFGTNSEIALWDGQTLWVTSAAGGPAFEGCGVRCGLPAEPGAIHRVTRRDDGGWAFAVIAGEEPRGLCGSGLVDLIAGLVGSGELTRLGRFASSVPDAGWTLARGERDIVLTKRDVDLLQRAKAAIGVGVQVLLAQAGLKVEDLQRLYVSGAFGESLDVANAQAIGLLPGIAPERVELCGNTALAGCEDALFSPEVGERLQRLADRARIVNLSHCADFDTLFFENLYLEPL